MSDLSDIIDGAVTTLENNVDGLKGYNYLPNQIHQFPAAVIQIEPIDLEIAFSGNTIEGVLRVTVFFGSGDMSEAFIAMYDGLDPTETNKSIVAALRADPTLNSSVDSSDPQAAENIGRREGIDAIYAGFDILVPFIKTIA